MKKSSKKALQARGVVVAGRAQIAPTARTHDDKRRAARRSQKQELQRQIRFETARNRGPFPFSAFPSQIARFAAN